MSHSFPSSSRANSYRADSNRARCTLNVIVSSLLTISPLALPIVFGHRRDHELPPKTLPVTAHSLEASVTRNTRTRTSVMPSFLVKPKEHATLDD